MKKRNFNLTILGMTILLSMIMLLFFIYPQQKITFSSEVDKTQALLANYSKRDVAQTEAAVANAQNLLLQKESEDKNTLRYHFINTVIFGDSIAEGLVDYRILDESVCIGRRGARIDTIDEDFNAIKKQKPSIIFLEYGLNDIGYWNGDAARFIAVYEEKLKKMQEELPHTKFYVNAILPIDNAAIQKNPIYESYHEFNRQMEALCRKYHCTFIDNGNLLNQLEIKYEYDGIHPKYDFYNLWAENMAKVAGL